MGRRKPRYPNAYVYQSLQAVTPIPDTTSVGVDVNGGAAAGTPAVNELGVADFLVLACDGLWDCMSNQQVGITNPCDDSLK